MLFVFIKRLSQPGRVEGRRRERTREREREEKEEYLPMCNATEKLTQPTHRLILTHAGRIDYRVDYGTVKQVGGIYSRFSL